MSRIIKPDTAFSGSTYKEPRKKQDDHLRFVRKLPCIVTGHYGVEAAHVRYASRQYAKRECGKQEKPDDRWVVPLCPASHRLQHSMEERRFWEKNNIDPLLVALLLHSVSGDLTKALAISEMVINGTAARYHHNDY
jgi:hypothetical protein